MDNNINKSNHFDNKQLSSSSSHRKTFSEVILSKLYSLRTSNRDDQVAFVESQPTSTNTSITATSASNPEFGASRGKTIEVAQSFSKTSNRSIAIVAHQKNRRRKGSLRKAALLGHGAQQEKKDIESSLVNSENKKVQNYFSQDDDSDNTCVEYNTDIRHLKPQKHHTLSSSSSSSSPSPSSHLCSDVSDELNLHGYSDRLIKNSSLSPIITTTLPMGKTDQHMNLPNIVTSPTLSSYTSTTDEDEIVNIPQENEKYDSKIVSSHSSRNDSYFSVDTLSLAHYHRHHHHHHHRHRSVKKNTRSPLSMAGLASNPLPVVAVSSTGSQCGDEWDYSETEWWGWVLLFVTWMVFVVGMGSCLGVWSWAWDVGETPYAPPELEDDPTLPIVGYYPALIILTSVMAWVWVIVSWVGMKYFRHTKISGE